VNKYNNETKSPWSITPQLVANLAERYIEGPSYPDWSGLQAALLETYGFDRSQAFEVMQAIREGNY
jgi:hypothetical protein